MLRKKKINIDKIDIENLKERCEKVINDIKKMSFDFNDFDNLYTTLKDAVEDLSYQERNYIVMEFFIKEGIQKSLRTQKINEEIMFG